MSVEEIQPMLPEIVAAMGDMDRRVAVATSKSEFVNMKPDIKWIEELIYRAYTTNS